MIPKYNEWQSKAMVKEYAAKAVDTVVGWYEYEVNFPDLVRLIPSEAQSLIDFGCGPGEFTKKLSVMFPIVVGVDMAPMLRIAHKNFPDINFVEWNGSTYPYNLIKVDVIFSKLTLQFVKDLNILTAHFVEILNDNGFVIFSVPNSSKISEKFNLKADSISIYKDEIGNTGIKIYPIYRSQQVYINTFEKAGLILVEISEPKISKELQKKYNVPVKYCEQSNRLNMKFQKHTRH